MKKKILKFGALGSQLIKTRITSGLLHLSLHYACLLKTSKNISKGF